MQLKESYDVAIVGGGLAGLSAAIVLAREGYAVVLFEKEKYPFHKVCGEYISNESKNYLKWLGLDIEKMQLPSIDTLLLTSTGGRFFTTKLPLGGFGISRYKLDKHLADLAVSEGVHLLDNTKVDEITNQESFLIKFSSDKCSLNSASAKTCCAAFGKRSNIDIKWKRNFLNKKESKLNNLIAVKYHVKTDWKSNVIGLHNFTSGYCGISKIENDESCLCYMTTAESLKNNHNDIKTLEQGVLYRNQFLKTIFENSRIVDGFPITISQINFAAKEKVLNGILMLGDAAGLITPLCGNGMSIALHSGKLAAELIIQHLMGNISRTEMEKRYEDIWNKQFASRFRMGRRLQAFFGDDRLSNSFVRTFQILPFLSKSVIKRTHGKVF
jgi:flavin-dependent dehydrogenase